MKIIVKPRKNQLKLESNSTTIPQKIKILEQHKQCIEANIEKLQSEMMEAATNLQFERAAELRDKIKELEGKLK